VIEAKRLRNAWEAFMARRNVPFQAAFLAGSMLAWPAMAADVTSDRLLNADNEPQNWLMNHRTYDGQRFSPLARINRDTVRNLKLAYAVPLGGGAGNEFSNATPLAEDGFLYVTDSWNVLYKIDTRSATSAASCGAWIPSRIVRCAAAARRSRATSSSPAPAVSATRRASSQPTRNPARRFGKPHSRTRRT
jgi:glucose dehydrogenase